MVSLSYPFCPQNTNFSRHPPSLHILQALMSSTYLVLEEASVLGGIKPRPRSWPKDWSMNLDLGRCTCQSGMRTRSSDPQNSCGKRDPHVTAAESGNPQTSRLSRLAVWGEQCLSPCHGEYCGGTVGGG